MKHVLHLVLNRGNSCSSHFSYLFLLGENGCRNMMEGSTMPPQGLLRQVWLLLIFCPLTLAFFFFMTHFQQYNAGFKSEDKIIERSRPYHASLDKKKKNPPYIHPSLSLPFSLSLDFYIYNFFFFPGPFYYSGQAVYSAWLWKRE